jgi:hypothetical protein
VISGVTKLIVYNTLVVVGIYVLQVLNCVQIGILILITAEQVGVTGKMIVLVQLIVRFGAVLTNQHANLMDVHGMIQTVMGQVA